MSNCDDPRRTLAKRLIAKYPQSQWVAKLMITPETAANLSTEELAETQAEFLLFSPEEVLWSLPATTEIPPPAPVGVKMQTTGALNVRDAPSILGAIKGVLAQGTVIVVGDVSLGWRPIVDGTYKGCYVSDKYLKNA